MKTSVIIDKTLKKLRERGDISAYEFSRDWLMKTPSYWAYTKSSGAEPSFECLRYIRKKALQEQKECLEYIKQNINTQPTQHIDQMLDTAQFYGKIAEDVEKALLS